MYSLYLLLSFISNRNISIYNQTNVTISEKAPYHSIYFGRPFSAPSSIKSKSKTRFRAAIPTTNMEKPIPNNPLEWIKPIQAPKKDMMKLTRYKSIMPIVAEKSINLKFSVGLIIPLL